MLRWVYRATPLALILALLPVQAQADGQTNAGKPMPAIDTKLQRAKTQVLGNGFDERQQRMAIVDRTNNVFTLLISEMALNQGQIASALATYGAMLERTHDAEVAERGIEMALTYKAIPQAQALLDRWRRLEPVPTAAQKRMLWEMAVARGETATVASGLDEVLTQANEHKARRVFLLMAQMSLHQPEVVQAAAGSVHQAARRYDGLPEAMIADAIFSAQSGRSQDAVGALQRLAALDGDVRPATQLTLTLISQRQPQVLTSFFKQTDIEKLSPMWQSLYVDTLISSNQAAQAYGALQKMLAKNPSADLYLQAGFLSVNQKASRAETLDYLEKAYRIGTQEQKSRAAFLAATRLMDDKQTGPAQVWAQRIDAADMAFDKHVLLASIEAEKKNWRAAAHALAAAEALTARPGHFYDGSDLWRLRLFVIAQSQSGAQALASYNRLLAQAQKAEQTPDQQAQLSDVLYQRGLLYADRLQQPQRAVADLRRYVAINPTSADGLNALGYTLLSLPKSHWPEATRLIESAYQIDSLSGAINDSLGWAYFLNGNAEAALPHLQFAFLERQDGEVAAHLGEVLWSLGRHDEARTTWRQGLQHSPQNAVLRNTLKRLGVTMP